MPDLDLAARFGLSLAIGLLIGVERERVPEARAGLRTFALIALSGTLGALVGERSGFGWFMAVPLLAIAAALIAVHNAPPAAEGDRGMTTLVAAVVCYCLGALLWWDLRELAVALGLATTALLYFKAELHGFSQGLTRQDAVAFLRFAAITFVVLPVLPDHGYGPYGALNPFRIWLMVVLISGLSLAGYVALRTFGERHGPLLLGALGGVASSTATTLTFARHARDQPRATHVASVIVLLANLVVLLRIAVVTAIVLPAALAQLLPMLGAGALSGAAFLAWHRRRRAAQGDGSGIAMHNPTDTGVALSFGLLFAAVLLASAWLNDVAGDLGLYSVAFISGLTDVDALTLSTLRLLETGSLAPHTASTAIAIAYGANLVFKAGMAHAIGGAAFGRDVALGFGAVVVGLAGGWALA